MVSTMMTAGDGWLRRRKFEDLLFSEYKVKISCSGWSRSEGFNVSTLWFRSIAFYERKMSGCLSEQQFKFKHSPKYMHGGQVDTILSWIRVAGGLSYGWWPMLHTPRWTVYQKGRRFYSDMVQYTLNGCNIHYRLVLYWQNYNLLCFRWMPSELKTQNVQIRNENLKAAIYHKWEVTP